MNIYDAIVQDYPFAFYKFLTTATSYANQMGGSNAAAASGTSFLSDLSMVTGPTKSITLPASAQVVFPFPERFSKEYNGLPFSLETWIGMDGPGYFLAMTHTGSTDGIYFDGNYISFAIDLDPTGQIAVKWPVPTLTKTYHVVGTYNGNKISLYIDGVLRAEAAIPDGTVLLTKANKNIYFATPAGRTARMEAPALYYKELGADRVLAHYRAGRALMGSQAAVSMYSGALWKFSDERRDVLYAKDVDFTVDGIGASVSPGLDLEPMYDPSDLSVAGTYTLAVPLADNVGGSPPTVQGMKIEWDGDGTFTVQYSLNNGGSWTTAVNGEVQTSTMSMAATVVPQIKITFPSGAAKGANIVRNMRVTAYKTVNSYAVNSNERNVVLSGLARTTTGWSEPIEQDMNSGASFTNTAYGIVSESLETDFTSVGTIEFWFNPSNISAGAFLIDSRGVTPSNASYIWIPATGIAWSGFSAVYINGTVRTSGTVSMTANRWYHIVGVYTAPHNAKISLNPAVGSAINEIELMTLYPGSLTAAQVLALFNSYFAYPVLAAEDANTITVQETAPASKAYVADWSIQGAG